MNCTARRNENSRLSYFEEEWIDEGENKKRIKGCTNSTTLILKRKYDILMENKPTINISSLAMEDFRHFNVV